MFTIFDKDKIPVTLTKEVWIGKLLDPVKGHPEVKDYLEEIKLTIQEPDFIFQSIRDERSKLLYKGGLTAGKYKDCFILVVVKYVKEADHLHGYISTVMLTGHVKKGGGLLWQR
ncbi:MAG: hypothetical protein A3G93_09875 [Nitrospinae bacterium RIFCSPLOWO2_12_FULL_45_22]|nr:MAG: hypothetical protein A3G93_09875 [Nitrospinae bacterium RIFCSPLOWO2_12_FULL_45_22]